MRLLCGVDLIFRVASKLMRFSLQLWYRFPLLGLATLIILYWLLLEHQNQSLYSPFALYLDGMYLGNHGAVVREKTRKPMPKAAASATLIPLREYSLFFFFFFRCVHTKVPPLGMAFTCHLWTCQERRARLLTRASSLPRVT